MGISMDSFVEKGQSEVKDKLKEGTDKISGIGDEFKGVKEQLSDMPDGLDSDLANMIKDAEQSGRAEAMSDIESARASLIDTAKSAADTIKSGVTDKINDNNTARGKLDSISSKYGKDAIGNAKTDIDANTQKGQDLLSNLADAIRDADKDVEQVKSSL